MRANQWLIGGLTVVFLIILNNSGFSRTFDNVSPQTRTCLSCHKALSPGMVDDWSNSRMSQVTPRQAMKEAPPQRRISADNVPDSLADTVVGCAECHTLNPDAHDDTFAHQGAQVHTVVTPGDCAVCHPVEEKQFRKNIMAEAYGNLMDNTVYESLIQVINGPMKIDSMALKHGSPNEQTQADACLSCHGTKLSVKKTITRNTKMGPMDFPEIKGWPNQGVGRVNPDGTKGSCAACHTRHRFAIETARKPDTCAQCHKGPDVPAYKVYKVSKHGNIYSAMHESENWDFDAVPWTVGDDFTAPTCATCHVSMLTNGDGDVLAERTHRMNDRLARRIFGLPYAHAHPKSADTTKIKNRDGLPLPTAFDGTPAEKYLISESEMDARNQKLKSVCNACHSKQWTNGHFEKLENSIETTNADTKVATQILMKGWEQDVVSGLADGNNPFDETLERMWVEQWLFYANSIRFASAMMGADYGVFANGRWYLTKNAREMMEKLKLQMELDD
ncbi:MAG: multiheme c-type cytochrome [Thermodesulfobacteriota bacterium]